MNKQCSRQQVTAVFSESSLRIFFCLPEPLSFVSVWHKKDGSMKKQEIFSWNRIKVYFCSKTCAMFCSNYDYKMLT